MKMRTAALALVVGLLIVLAPAQVPQQTPDTDQPDQPDQQAPSAPKGPMAETEEELEAYQKLLDASLTPDQMISLAEEFVQMFPDSELNSFVYLKAMEGYRQKGDFPKLREFGEKSLAIDPENVQALLWLALFIPERTKNTDLDREEKLKQAEDYAKRALAAIEKKEKPDPEMLDTVWERAINDMRASSYDALGHVAMKRGRYEAAADFFKKTIDLQAEKDSIVLWRLGLTYRIMKKYELARDTLKQAVDAGGVKVGLRDLAAEELQRIEESLKKQ
jgi:tetratricopeptide (TPR) repeat protein